MKKDKLYLIISVLFVVVSIVLVNGFKGSFSDPVEEEYTLYWAVDGHNCSDYGYTCSLKISNNEIEGTHYDSNIFNSSEVFTSSTLPWYNYHYTIESITIGGEDDIIKPISIAYWFVDLSRISTIDLSYLNTTNVTNMSSLFNGCTSLNKIIGLDQIDTSKVENMSKMFYDTMHLGNLDLSTFDVSKVTDMSYMFDLTGRSCKILNIVGLDEWNTSQVTNMSYMFSNAGKEASEWSIGDISKWDTSKVENMSKMFYGIEVLNNKLDLNGWNTSKVINSDDMLADSLLVEIKVGDKWNIPLSNNTWFNSNTEEKYENGNIPKNVEATYVTYKLFWALDGSDCNSSSGKCTLKISNNAPTQYYASGFFDVNKILTSQPWNGYNYNKSICKFIIGGENDIIKPVSVKYWFDNLNSITELDFTYFDASNIDSSEILLDSTSKVEKIIVNDSWNLLFSTVRPWISLKDYELYYGNNIPSGVAATYVRVSDKLYWAVDGNNCTVENAGCTLKINSTNIEGEHFFSGSFNNGYIRYLAEEIPWYKYRLGIKKIIVGSEDYPVAPYNTEFWFYEFKNTEIFDFKYFKSNLIKCMRSMFLDTGYNTSNFELDLSGWDTSNVEDMSSLFFSAGHNATTWNIGNLSNWNTLNVTNMSYMFSSAGYNSNEFKLDLSNWDTLNVTNMSHMFSSAGYNANEFELDLSGWNASKVTDMSHMFSSTGYNANEFELDLSGFDTSNVTNMSGMFYSTGYNANEFELDLSSFNTSKVTDMSHMFYYSPKISVLNISGFDTSKVTNLSDMFLYNNSLKKIIVGDKWNLSFPENNWQNIETKKIYNSENVPKNVAATYIIPFIYWSINDNILILSNSPVDGNVTSGSIVFSKNNNNYYRIYEDYWGYYNDLIEKIKIGGPDDIIKPIYMSGWFYYLYKVKEIDLTYLDTSDTNDMSYAFSTGYYDYIDNEYKYFSALEKIIGLENLDTGNVEHMSYMFADNYNLEEINVSGWNTSNVEDMTEMFARNISLERIIGLESFNTENVESFNDMFIYDKSLISLDLSSFDTSNGSACPEPSIVLNSNVNTKVNNSYENDCNIFLGTDALSEVKVGRRFNFYLSNSLWQDKNTKSIYKNGEIPPNKNAIYIRSLIYWAIDNGTLIISNNNLKDYEIYGILNTNDYIYNQYSWKDYLSEIDEIIIEDSISPYYMNEWFSDLTKVKKLDLSNIDTINLISESKLLNNMISLEELNLGNIDLDKNNKCVKLEIEEYEEYEEYEPSIIGYSPNPNINFKVETPNYDMGLCLEAYYYCNELDDMDACEEFDVECPTFEEALSEDSCEAEQEWCEDGYDESCVTYEAYCSGPSKSTCLAAYSACFDASLDDGSCEFYENACPKEMDELINETTCESALVMCEEGLDYSCYAYDNYCIEDEPEIEIINEDCNIFSNNNNLRKITVGDKNINTVKESLAEPDDNYIESASGKWYDRNGNEYLVEELENKVNTYYANKPYMIKYNANVDNQAKLVGEDLTLYDEIIKDSDTAEIITKFDTVGGNDIDDVTSLKITTYSLKDFTDGDGNTYLPGSKYTKDEDLELDVNYNSEDHYNEIELPIPVKQGYKFEYWTLDGERIDEYTPKTNKTLVAVWTEIKYNFIDGTDNVNYEEESEDKVIFITDGIIENFKNLYVNGKRLEKGEDYTLDGNKIVLTEKGKEYLDSLEPGEYEVKAEFADSNDYVYGIIKVSEKEEPKVEPDEPKEEPNSPKEEEPEIPSTPKTSDYILFTVIIALTALISSIFVYKKIEY